MPIFSYFTLANGRYIIRIRPIASGILVVPLEKELINTEEEKKDTDGDTNDHGQEDP
ncbi:hypothetical protein H9N25_21050 [Pedobacter riviphilus]|uniref:Uncharacterized protein n=1 Tax=Pedobacter riviphilus TaxID=2766984 RepID=A0ABX6TFT0_9SPHI|nr:hypothetical protein [Pedobacter riviphilus]QNR84363.1 hypothetical protein H9N25_21050 [Pedobacter riviphilus]